jgi:hypothetical protein
MKEESLTPTEAVKRLELSDKVEGIKNGKTMDIETAMATLYIKGDITQKQYDDYRILTFVEPTFPLFQYNYPKRKEGENFWEYWGKRLFIIK